MSIAQLQSDFHAAKSADFHKLLQLTKTGHDYLLVSGRRIDLSMGASTASKRTFFDVPLPKTDADETLNAIMKWVRDENVFDQRDHHGDDFGAYNISFYRLSAGAEGQVTRAAEFGLANYQLSYDKVESFDGMMWGLDRCRLGFAMREALVQDFGIKPREDAPAFWLRDVRIASHSNPFNR